MLTIYISDKCWHTCVIVAFFCYCCSKINEMQLQKAQIHHSTCRFDWLLINSFSFFPSYSISNTQFLSLKTTQYFWMFQFKNWYFEPLSVDITPHQRFRFQLMNTVLSTYIHGFKSNVLIVSPQNVKRDFKIRNFPIELRLIWSGLPIESSSVRLVYLFICIAGVVSRLIRLYIYM